ncbi:MAG TPA: helix-turn-helix transcriptional regulator [Saprospiraceae bacterium]|nr:helix-turn-helix transcriptional regulator [Saprospiraceae bacterium]
MSIDAQEYQKKFGQRIKQLRISINFSQLDLAVACGLEKTAISRIENGRTNITLKTALILRAALNVELKDLFDLD